MKVLLDTSLLLPTLGIEVERVDRILEKIERLRTVLIGF
jgi:hypothetical protein